MRASVDIQGKPLACVVCGHGEFNRRRALLNTRGATFFGMDFLNQAATILACGRCGYVHWFVPAPGDLGDDFDCPSCGTRIPPDQEGCAACGWTYGTPLGR